MSTPRDRIEAKLGLAGPQLSHLREGPPRIPDHELIRPIGRGAYGEVWLARNALGTLRAVKIVFRDNFKDARPYEREFAGIRRFEPLSRSNEGFVDILQVGRDDVGGWFYYVMELADDVTPVFQPATQPAAQPTVMPVFQPAAQPAAQPTVTPVFQPAAQPTGKSALQPDTYQPRTLSWDLHHRGRLPLEDCLELGLTLSFALGHLHRHGLIHRDIKPSNIIFVGGVPKLADIGLVTESEGANTFVGTEGFIPPEGPTSPQADLYALGKVLYEAAMGKDRNEFPEPFTQIGTDRESVALMELNVVLLRACMPDRKTRYASAEEMHADLAILHSGGSVKRRHRLEQQFRLVKQVGAAAIVATLLIGAAWLWQRQQTEQMTRLAQEKTTLATEKTKLADNLARLGEENRRRLAHMNVASGVRLLDEGDPAGALLWFSEALSLVNNKPADESIHRIRIQQTLNEIPRVLQVFPHENTVWRSAFSEDGRRIATGTELGYLCVWDAHSGARLWQTLALGGYRILQVRFTPDSQCVFASSLPGGGILQGGSPTNFAVIVEAETGRQVVSLSGTNWIRVDLSPDGRWLVTADSEDVIHVHDARDGRPIADLKGHTDRILMFSFSTNGSVLASSSNDRTARLWRLPSGEPICPPIKFEHPLLPVTLKHDGTLLATATEDPQKVTGVTNWIIQTWDVKTGASVGPPIEMQGAIEALWFVSQGEHDLFVMTDKQCALFDPVSHQQVLQSIKTPLESPIYSVSPDGRRVAFAGREGLAGVWSFETGELLLPPCLRDRSLIDVNFSPDGSQLLALSGNGTATLLSSHFSPKEASYRFDAAMAKGPPKNLLEWHRFSPDRRHYLLILTDGTVRLVDFEQMTDHRIPAEPFKGLWPVQVTFDPTGRRRAIYYSGGDQHLVELWTEDGPITNRFVLPHPADLSGGLLFTPDGSRLLTPAKDGQVRVWKTSDGTLERSIQVQTVGPSVIFPDGRSAFGVSEKLDRYALFDLATGSSTGTHMPPFLITAQIFNSSGDRFATAGSVDWSRVWSARTCEPLTPPLHHGGEVRFVAWSPDDRRLLTAGLTPEVKVWDAATGEELLAPLHLGAKPLETGLWSLDGRLIVARSDDNLVRVWDAATGEPVTPLLKHNSYVRLAHLVANNRLITLSLPNLMRAWDLTETRLPADVIADYAKLVSGRRFNATGVTVPATPSELADLCRSLRARAPQLFE